MAATAAAASKSRGATGAGSTGGGTEEAWAGTDRDIKGRPQVTLNLHEDGLILSHGSLNVSHSLS